MCHIAQTLPQQQNIDRAAEGWKERKETKSPPRRQQAAVLAKSTLGQGKGRAKMALSSRALSSVPRVLGSVPSTAQEEGTNSNGMKPAGQEGSPEHCTARGAQPSASLSFQPAGKLRAHGLPSSVLGPTVTQHFRLYHN